MGETEESLEPQSVLSDLHDAVDAVFLALENNNEWGLSGKRPDQYISDVVACLLYTSPSPRDRG